MIEQSEIRAYLSHTLDGVDSKKETPDLSHILPTVKGALIEMVLIHTRGNQSKAAKILGISRGTLKLALEKSRQTS